MADRRDIVVIGASAGGVEALRSLMVSLPADFLASVLVVTHLPAGSTSALPMILDRAGVFPAVRAKHGLPLRHGTVYVAPPDHHLLLGADDTLTVSHGPTENGQRPAVNALFRSAALLAGPRTIGVVLSGVLDDGASGLRAIRARDGIAVVQESADALYPAMPDAAARGVDRVHAAAAAEMGPLLDKLVRREFDVAGAPSAPERHPGTPAPTAMGYLIELEPGSDQYQCRLGRTWSAEALRAAQGTTPHRVHEDVAAP